MAVEVMPRGKVNLTTVTHAYIQQVRNPMMPVVPSVLQIDVSEIPSLDLNLGHMMVYGARACSVFDRKAYSAF